jgi:hypothetical protein
MGSTIIWLVISRHILNGQKGSQGKEEEEEVDITFVCTATRTPFAYLSKYLNVDFVIEVVVIGLNPDYAFIWVYNTLMLQIA